MADETHDTADNGHGEVTPPRPPIEVTVETDWTIRHGDREIIVPNYMQPEVRMIVYNELIDRAVEKLKGLAPWDKEAWIIKNMVGRDE